MKAVRPMNNLGVTRVRPMVSNNGTAMIGITARLTGPKPSVKRMRVTAPVAPTRALNELTRRPRCGSGSGDHRARVIELTPASKPLMQKINRIQNTVRAALLKDIAPADLTACLAVFAQILDNADHLST